MKFSSFIFITTIVSLTNGAAIQLERRKSFIETHQEHGHLPGGSNNPGITALIPQLMAMIGGKNPAQVLNEYNQKADEKNGKEYGGSGSDGGSKGGLMSSLGLEDIPIVGGLM
ncbi:hypothetical protein K502DRAFT_179226 [Neoconidiobolus thromboides FSU 785]|nr:hypothetical protein K502DRAFT_179226 [Neoconidiobolus thromboides FSU 785]